MICLAYENCFEGFLSAVFDAFTLKDAQVALTPDGENLPGFFEVRPVKADSQKAARVSAGLKRLSPWLEKTVYEAWLSRLPDIDDDILAVLKMGFKDNRDPLVRRYDKAVARVAAAADKVATEAHRFLQFVRFTGVGGLFVADIEPMFDILPLIGNHFHKRYGCQRFVIRDLERGRAIVSDPSGWCVTPLSEAQREPLGPDGQFEAMWREYFKAIANLQRKNLKLQQKFIPLRYRKHLTEFNGTPGNP